MYSFDRYFFSRRGSYLLVDSDQRTGELKVSTLRNVTGGVNDMFRISSTDASTAEFTPWELQAKAAGSSVRICLFGSDSMYIRGEGGPLVLEYVPYGDKYIANYHYYNDGRLYLCDYKTGAHQCYTPVKGSVAIEAPRARGEIMSDYVKVILQPDERGEFEAALEQFYSPSPVLACMEHPYDQCVKEAMADYLRWEKQLECKTDADRDVAYALWINIVSPSGNYAHEAMLMSKAGMGAVWSWDNCINAMALAKYDFDFAYEQIKLPYRYMDAHGCAPDYIRDTYIDRCYVKPPIQGFIYPYLVKMNARFASPEVLRDLYPLIRQNTDWWISMRGERPYYLHGNDSGADNATCFDYSEVVSTPELAALLSVQCEFLSKTARQLDYAEDAQKYAAKAGHYLRVAAEDHFDGALFTKEAFGQQKVYSNSLLPMRVLALGDKLPREVIDYCLERIRKHHFGSSGLSSEAIDSPEYTPDGYWRGPAWAPDQVIFALALFNLGENELAEKVCRDFMNGVERLGFYENLCSTQERGLRAKCYTWTASAYIILKELLSGSGM